MTVLVPSFLYPVFLQRRPQSWCCKQRAHSSSKFITTNWKISLQVSTSDRGGTSFCCPNRHVTELSVVGVFCGSQSIKGTLSQFLLIFSPKFFHDKKSL